MQFARLVFVVVLVTGGTCSLYEHRKLIADFLDAKSLHSATVFGCDGKRDAVKLVRNLEKFRLLYYSLGKVENVSVRTALHRHTHLLGVVIDGDCDMANILLQRCGAEKLIDTSFHWLLITETNFFAPKFMNVSVHLDSNFNVAVPNETGRNQNYTIWDVYNPSTEHGGELKVSELGYSDRNGYNARIKGNKYWARKNMTGLKFKSAIMIPVEFNLTVEEYLANDSHTELNSMHRFQATTIRHCQDMYNFEVSIKKSPSWGYVIPNSGGKFDGVVGMLQRREIDFGCTPLLFKYDRLPVIDYSFGNWILKSVFIYQPPKGTASSFEIFTRPLGRDVWYCTVVASTLTIITMKVMTVVERLCLKEDRPEVDSRWMFAFLTTFGAFCMQGGSYCPNLLSGRILVVVLFVFYVLLYQFYAGFIVSYLLMDPPRLINSLGDLLHSSLDVGIEDILIDKSYEVQTTDPIAIEIYKKSQSRNRSGYYVPEIGLDMVQKGGFAYHVETSTAYPLIRRTFAPKKICALEEVQMYSTQPMHTNAQKHSPFREMFNFCMLRLVEHGLMYRLRKKWDTRRPECIEADYTIEITVGLEEFYCAPAMLFAGILTSLFLLGLEVFWSKRQEAKMSQVAVIKRRKAVKVKKATYKGK